MEAEIDDGLRKAKSSINSLLNDLGHLEQLAKRYPFHPKLGGAVPKLETLANGIDQFCRKLEPNPAFSKRKQ